MDRIAAGSDRRKNDFYRKAFRTMMLIVKIEASMIVVIGIALTIYLNTRQDQDHYYAETSDLKIMPMVSLHLPNMGRMAISDWAASAASQIMTFGFNDVDAKFAVSQKYFTHDGWETFRKAVIATKLVEEMLATQQIVTSVPASPPVLKMQGLINGKDGWVYDVPLLVTFRAGGAKSSRAKTVHMVIQKMPTRENPNGVGIDHWDIY
jgi:intracellular multiplication protein IcmL